MTRIARWPLPIGAVQVRLALQCVVSLLIALAVMRLLPLPKPYWLALTALMVTANSFGETAAKSLERVIGTAAGLLAGTLVWFVSSNVPAVPVVIVVVSVFALYYERTARYRTMLFWLSLLLSLLFHLADAPGRFYLARLVDTLLGTAIAVLVTVVLLPVHTGDQVRDLLADLLDLTAAKLRHMAATLSQPGTHARERGLQDLLDTADKLRAVATAEGLEALLLRRPRMEVRQRQAAVARITRCLLYADQLVPLLPGRDAEAGDLLRGLGAAIGGVAASVRRGTSPPPLPERPVAFEERFMTAHRGGRISLAQLQASLRLVEVLSGLTEAIGRLAASAPKSEGD
jgi:uncharacterized membrane protein YccC